MIRTYQELKFYIFADRMMNGYFDRNPIKRLFSNDKYIFRFLKYLRYSEYLNIRKRINIIYWLPYLYTSFRYRRLSLVLGYDIPYYTIGYGVRLPHFGGFVINGINHIGNYCSVMYGVCIADAYPKKIGNGIFFGTNAVCAKGITIADGTKIGANSFVNKDIYNKCELWGGVNAHFIKKSTYWYKDEKYLYDRYKIIEAKRIELGID